MIKYSLRRIAIDGLAASGKSTVAKALAHELALKHLDTGALYRAVAYSVIASGLDHRNESAVSALAKKLEIAVTPESISVNGKDITKEIRSKETTQVVSQIASYNKVRKQLRKKQLRWLDENNGGVLEGRDIGTVILPKADLKVFVVASPEIRAERRAKESNQPLAEVLDAIKERDESDKNRKHAPLKQAEDAMLVDTTNKEVDEVVDEIMAEVKLQYEKKLKEFTQDIDPLTSQDFWLARIFVKSLRLSAYGVFRTYFRGRIYNRKNIPKQGPIILAPAAHRSNLDTIVIGAIAPRLMRYMAKDSLYMKGRFWSRFLLTVGAFPIRRNRLDRKSLMVAREFLKQGQAVAIFPEGERKEGHRVFPLLAGVVWLSIHAQIPVLPIGLAGTDIAMPIGKKIFHPKKIVVYVGKPIVPPKERVKRKELERLNEELRETLQNLYDKAFGLL